MSPTAVATERPTLTPVLRQACDRCPARAAMAYTKGSLLLLFCGHHTQAYAAALHQSGFAGTALVTPHA